MPTKLDSSSLTTRERRSDINGLNAQPVQQKQRSIADVCSVIKTCFMRANDMLMPKDLREAKSIKGWKFVESKALRVYTQLYSLQAIIASGMLSSVIPSDHIEDFRRLSVFVAEKVTPDMDDLILSLQTAAADLNSDAAALGGKKT